ncbi:response regulator [Haloferula sp. BvORR071]|uniref:response regulator transcription factor n=1 Tax=Haloferula sp. BvORR071 TaxID=1396141 RepID=UPI00054E2C33|nr:response regulator [Haloferula sp. BvORR071]
MKATVSEIPVVHLIDDDESLRTALRRVISTAGHAVKTYGSAAEFLLAREGSLRGCLVLDVRMPGGASGLELHKALVRQGETLPVIFITGHGDIPMGVQAIKDGAFDFLTKPVESDCLLTTIRDALATEEATCEASDRLREIAARASRLTPAEREVFRHVVEGLANKQIAAELHCSERTVKAHRSQVMSKMGASSLADLVHLSEMLALPAA